MIELQALTLRSSFPARNPELIVYLQSSLPVEKGRKGRRGKKKVERAVTMRHVGFWSRIFEYAVGRGWASRVIN